MKHALLAVLLLSAPACYAGRFTDNEPLRADLVKQLQPGRSTAQEVVAVLGAPVDVVQLGKRSAYLYQYTAVKGAGFFIPFVFGLANGDQRSDRVWVFFDESQVLTHVGATFAGENVEYAMPFQDVHD